MYQVKTHFDHWWSPVWRLEHCSHIFKKKLSKNWGSFVCKFVINRQIRPHWLENINSNFFKFIKKNLHWLYKVKTFEPSGSNMFCPARYSIFKLFFPNQQNIIARNLCILAQSSKLHLAKKYDHKNMAEKFTSVRNPRRTYCNGENKTISSRRVSPSRKAQFTSNYSKLKQFEKLSESWSKPLKNCW